MASDNNIFPLGSQSARTVPNIIFHLDLAVKNLEAYLKVKVRDLENKANIIKKLRKSYDNIKHLNNWVAGEPVLLGAARELVHTQVRNQHRAEMVQFFLEPVVVAEALHLALAAAAAVLPGYC
ncbi:hypothetical protein CTI12_AA138410 [Artemisia annua]|uniref:Uncharacterized protein n=1 Tax=Artemisia annua TaxID=35608 RepID=A0A2U1PLS8_ARTAN|nr:hypothetical protein CTI12_AA138410 [Artemisia annua]